MPKRAQRGPNVGQLQWPPRRDADALALHACLPLPPVACTSMLVTGWVGRMHPKIVSGLCWQCAPASAVLGGGELAWAWSSARVNCQASGAVMMLGLILAGLASPAVPLLLEQVCPSQTCLQGQRCICLVIQPIVL